MSKQTLKWPARVRRNALVKEVSGFSTAPASNFFDKPFWVAGRIVGVLDDGFVLQDESGRIDVVFDHAVNAGDIVEARIIVEERTGEDGKVIKLFRAEECQTLAACTNDYFIRKSDPNWKRTVVDLKLKELLRTRAEIIKKTREFFWERGFTEAETPQMVKLPGMEPYLDPFRTKLITQPQEGLPAQEIDAYLITSPEYAMKKMLVSGWEKIFQVTRSFRNRETAGSLHNPEFTLLEWYRAYDDYRGIMKDTEELVNRLAKEVCGGDRIVYGGNEIDTKTPWERKSVAQLFEENVGISAEALADRDAFFSAAVQKGYRLKQNAPYEDIFYTVFMNDIEPKLGLKKPLIVFDYPLLMAALAKKSEADTRFAERFEVYIGGVELCNAFTELNDPVEQEARLEEERKYREKLGKDNYPVDQSFIGALKFGMPPAGGNALGMDRLAMVLTGTEDIGDIMSFPLKDL